MTPDVHSWYRLEQRHTVSLGELAASSGLCHTELQELIDYGVLVPANPGESPSSFRSDCVPRAARATRLRNDLELDLHAVALAIALLDRIEELEALMATTRAAIQT